MASLSKVVYFLSLFGDVAIFYAHLLTSGTGAGELIHMRNALEGSSGISRWPSSLRNTKVVVFAGHHLDNVLVAQVAVHQYHLPAIQKSTCGKLDVLHAVLINFMREGNSDPPLVPAAFLGAPPLQCFISL